MWLLSALLVWALAVNTSFLNALIVASCITPTDPVLANTIIKGRFADKYVPSKLANLIAAESGANDGLGFPFLYLGLWILKGKYDVDFSVATGIAYWFGDTWCYVIILSVVWGVVVGYVGRVTLKLMDHFRYVERESFHGFAIFMALSIIGTCGLVGSDDVLCCFVAGNVMSWDDWFRRETMADSFQPTIDMMLNQAVFLWFGAAAPWHVFASSGDVIPLGRLIALAVLILLLRRPPVIFVFRKLLRQVPDSKYALFMGFFGPIGVSSIFYLHETLEFLSKEMGEVENPEEIRRLADLTITVVWFAMICSTVCLSPIQNQT